MGGKQNWSAKRDPINRTPSQAASLSPETCSSMLNMGRRAVSPSFIPLFTFHWVAHTVFCLFPFWKSSRFSWDWNTVGFSHIIFFVVVVTSYENIERACWNIAVLAQQTCLYSIENDHRRTDHLCCRLWVFASAVKKTIAAKLLLLDYKLAIALSYWSCYCLWEREIS